MDTTQIKCKLCGALMIEKEGKYGMFLTCNTYPVCKGARPLSMGVECPDVNCDGDIVQRKSKTGKIFYGCTQYPTCEITIWDKPVPEDCPECGNHYLVTKKVVIETKQQLVCPKKECGFKLDPFD